jgi:hypothetical protein
MDLLLKDVSEGWGFDGRFSDEMWAVAGRF